MNHRFAIAPAMALLLLAAACGSAAADGNTTDTGGSAAGTCLEGTSCDDTGIDPGGDLFPVDEARQQAHGVLGMNEADLADDVRVARRGDETFMLTDDYKLGRLTAELDDLDDGGFRVVSVTVELPDGPETFELQPG